MKFTSPSGSTGFSDTLSQKVIEEDILYQPLVSTVCALIRTHTYIYTVKTKNNKSGNFLKRAKQDGSAVNEWSLQNLLTWVQSWNPHDRREPILTNCPLTSTNMPWDMCIHLHTSTQQKLKKLDNKNKNYTFNPSTIMPGYYEYLLHSMYPCGGSIGKRPQLPDKSLCQQWQLRTRVLPIYLLTAVDHSLCTHPCQHWTALCHKEQITSLSCGTESLKGGKPRIISHI